MCLSGLCLLTVLVYRPALTAPFVYEDRQSLSLLGAFWWQWVAHLTRAPWAFHLENLLLHLVNGVLLAAICRDVWGWRVALMSATVFLLHPLQVESVAYITGQSELVSVFGLLSAVLIGVHAERVIAVVPMALCVAVAVWSKPASIVVVGLVPFALYVLDRRALIAPLLYALCVVGAWHAGRIQGILTNPYTFQSDLSPWVYVEQQAVALWTLLSVFLVPVGLSVDHDFGLSPFSACLIAVTGFGVALASAWQIRRTVPAYAALVGWLALALWPRFVMRTPEWLNEHQMAISIIGLSVAVGYVAAAFCGEVMT